MKKNISILTAALSMAVLTSCEKEIDVNYRNITPLYVIEANITDEGASASISQTQNVRDTLWNKSVDNAEVTITSDKGESFTLSLDSAGHYSSMDARGIAGNTYTIKVKIGDYVTEATSVMQGKFNVEDNFMYKFSMMSDDAFCYRVNIEDPGTERNYYYALMTRNGEPYKWEIVDNKGFYGTSEIDLGCFYDNDMEKEDEILHDGDVLSVEVRKVDKATYDYLYALALAERTTSNPTRSFSNNALGYFSACNITKLPEMVFKKSDVEPLEARKK